MAKRNGVRRPPQRQVRLKLAKPNELVTRKDLARAIMNYHQWRRREVWWRRIPRNLANALRRRREAANGA